MKRNRLAILLPLIFSLILRENSSASVTEIHRIEGLSMAGTEVAPDGNNLLLNYNETYWLYDFPTATRIRPFVSSPEFGNLNFSSFLDIQGDLAAFSSPQGIFLFNVQTGEQIRHLSPLVGRVKISGEYVVISETRTGGDTVAYNHINGSFLYRISEENGKISVFNNRLLLNFSVYDISTNTFVFKVNPPEPNINYNRAGSDVAIDDEYVVIGYWCQSDDCIGYFSVFDGHTGNLLYSFDTYANQSASSNTGQLVSISDGYLLAAGNGLVPFNNTTGGATLFDITNGSILAMMKGELLHGTQNEAFGGKIAFSGSNIAVASAKHNYTILYNFFDRAELGILNKEITEGSTDNYLEVRSTLPRDSPISFDYSFQSGSAILGEDVRNSSGRISLPAGQTSARIPIHVLDDLNVEGLESFEVSLSNPENATLGPNSIATVTIVDNDKSWHPLEGGSGLYTGFSVSISDDAILTGAPGTNSGTGAAGIIETGGSEDLELDITAADGEAGDEFGYSVAIQTDFLAIGAPGDSDFGSQSGSVYLYDRKSPGSSPSKLHGSLSTAAAHFGVSLAADNFRVMVGSHRDGKDGIDSGIAYLFEIFGSTAVETRVLFPVDRANGDHFGFSTALNFPFAVIGAPKDDDDGLDSGSAYLFNVNTNTQISKLSAPDGVAGAKFGWSVAITEQFIFVGAPDYPGGGRVYVFDANGMYLKTLFPEGTQQNFGFSLSVNPSFLSVGAPGDSRSASDNGSVSIFRLRDLEFFQRVFPKSPEVGQKAGRSVALGGDFLAFGAPFRDDTTESSNPISNVGAVFSISLLNAEDFDGFEVSRIEKKSQTSSVNLDLLCRQGRTYKLQQSMNLQEWSDLEMFEATSIFSGRNLIRNEAELFFRLVELPFDEIQSVP